MKKSTRIFKNLVTFLLTIAIILSGACFNFGREDIVSAKVLTERSLVNLQNQLKVHFIDVGQADCILIQQGNHNMLIDGGTGEAEDAIRNYLTGQNINTFDYVVGTHAHEDHIGSLDYVINSFNIGAVYFPKQIQSTRTFENFINAVRNKNLNLTAPKPGDTFYLGKAECKVLSPKKDSYDNINDSSIVIKITFGNTSFMMTGDAGTGAEKEMLSSGFNLKSDVLKVGHHGSSTATSSKFLDAVNPKYAVISVGRNNSYNLPKDTVINRLNRKNIKIYRTDYDGTVVATSDGHTISFN